MAGKRNVSVKPHIRNGKPVRGYTQRRSFGEHVAAMLRGDEPGSTQKAVALAGLLAVGTALWWTFSLSMSIAQAGVMTIGVLVGAALVLGGVKLKQSRRRRRSRSIIWSPRARWSHWKARGRRHMPRAVYRRRRDALRKMGDGTAGALFDHFWGTWEVTRTRRVNGKTEVFTKRVKGWKQAEFHRDNPGEGWKTRGKPRIVQR